MTDPNLQLLEAVALRLGLLAEEFGLWGLPTSAIHPIFGGTRTFRGCVA